MKNLKSYSEDCFKVYKEAVENENKNKDILLNIQDDIESQFDIYSGKFRDKKLYEITSLAFSEEEKESLINLYQYRSAIIQKIKGAILDSQEITINNTCQYCTLSEVSTLDHIIPKKSFPEFSVNPLNLFPCCAKCNSKKSNLWIKNDKHLFLNLYLDELPNKKYLIADFDFKDNIPMVTFSLGNPENIDNRTYEIIESHFSRLDLLRRMRERSNEKITDIINAIKGNYKLNSDIDSVKSAIRETEENNKKVYGYNHWKSVLILSIIEKDEFWNKFIVAS
ncbi:HNH endonuclease [Capnocytophaga gingivalis]|jgi:hypothetical protein|uniref:HNH endonuclease signature motif containing protein n=1 Tax=Capnocytophaga gingivalis TaxID=1017 RepID=A0ABU5YAH6_9FLAO|nr:HNH endonuclease signature motif containing protein [Capnocytophaga gingivalis]MEB3040404.1 HNH endonuclease signature motif containing protein [Capnocytophaga gingivalis]